MITITNGYEGELRTTLTHLKSGNYFITDAPPDNQGKGEAFSPTDLVAAALSACMMTTMGIKGQGMDLSGIRTEITKLMSSEPRRISGVRIEMYWEDCSANSDQIEFMKQTALTCPVALSLHPDIKQDIKFHF